MANENDAVQNLASFVDTKLTKSELVDIVVNDLVQELKVQSEKLEAMNKQVFFTFDEVKDVLSGLKFGFNRYSGDTNFSIEVRGDNRGVSQNKISKPVLEKLLERETIQKKIQDIGRRINQLQDKRGKVEVLKLLIDASPEGKQFLKLLDGMKVRLDATKLLAGKK